MLTRGERVITEERVQDQLRNVIDPEIGMDLVELGLIYDVGVHDEGRHVDVTFSLTSPMCPVGDLIQEQVETETLSIGCRDRELEAHVRADVEPRDDEPSRQAVLR